MLSAAVHALAQVGAASLSGVVEDSTGARIPDAKIRLINSLTGFEYDATSGHDGMFFLSGLISGAYTLQIERQGFATAQVTGLILNVGDAKNLLIRLKVGSVSETVEIDASAISVNTAEATVNTSLDRRFVMNVPVNGRSFQDLITMTPGVVTQSPQAIASPVTANGSLSVNGQMTNANYFLVDGVSGNFGAADLSGSRKIPSDGSQPALTALGTTQSLASVDALEEFRVLSSSYSAEYGTAPGGQFILVTRSGTGTAYRSIHGSMYYYGRYDPSDSIDWFEGFNEKTVLATQLSGFGNTVPYHQNDFGGTFGFSVPFVDMRNGHDQTYVFSSFEQVHVSQATGFLRQFIPSDTILNEAPSSLQSVLRDFPIGSFGEPEPPLVPGFSYSPLPSSLTATEVRLDRAFGLKTTVFLRYAGSPSDNESLNLTAFGLTHDVAQSWTLGATTELSRTRNNGFNFGYAKDARKLNTSVVEPLFYNAEPIVPILNFLPNLGIPSSYPSASGQIYLHMPGLGESTINADQATSAIHQWNLRDIFGFQAGSHFLRFGIDYRHIVSNVTPAPLSVEADFFDVNSLLNNSASDISITRTEPATPVFHEFSAFAQDEWRLSKTLTLSPGLRWEVDPPPHGEHDADAYTLLGSAANPSTLQLAPRGTPLWHTSWLNLAPRLGAAWSVSQKPGQELVLRAGAGLYFATGNGPAAAAFNAIGFSATNHLQNVPVPVTSAQLDFPTNPTAPYTNAFAFPRHLQLPLTFQWNVSVDRALGLNQLLNASWVGASGHRLLDPRLTDINVQNPDFGEIYTFPSGVMSSYESLQLKFQRSISPGVQALASYAWSHALDYGSTAPEFPLVYGNSDLDVRHNLQAVVSWQQHPRDGNWLVRYFLGGWAADGRFTARTGFPVNLMGNLFSDPATGDRYLSGVDLVPGRPLYVYGSQYPGGRAFNGGPNAVNPAFVLPAGSNAGNAPRNLVRDFGDVQMNAAIAQDLHFSKWFNLHLRAEAFNLFNHPELGYIDPVVSNALFGQATLLLNQSFGSGGPLYEPGGPRSLQFSARIHF